MAIIAFPIYGVSTFLTEFLWTEQSDQVQQIPIEQSDEPTLKLIRQTLIWADSENSIDLLPVVLEDSIYARFDLELHQENLERLRATNLFSSEFIDNYDNIIQNLDKKLRNNEFEYSPWYLGDLPPFNFANDYSPWCNCQDNRSWETVQIKQIDEQTFNWTWGQNWEDFKYTFRVAEEEGKLKITYMEGFENEK